MSLLDRMKSKFLRANLSAVVFTSFGGRYTDSPKAISEELHRLAPNVRIIWLVKPQNIEEIPSYAEAIDIDSKQAFRIRNVAKILVDNVYCDSATELTKKDFLSNLLFQLKTFLKTKNTQIRITTWHGTPLKKMGKDQVGSQIINFSCPNTIMFLGNQHTADVMHRLTFGNIPIRLLGCPRNDVLFNCSNIEKDEIKKHLGIDQKKKIILYAPTFRSDGIDINNSNLKRSGLDQLESLDVEELLSTLHDVFPGDWVLICRFHYFVDTIINWEFLNRKYNGRIINGNAISDMSQYLLCSDALITDASSCMFDFLFTSRPCFLYFPDIENYATQERGLYFNIEELPFSLSKNNDELINSIRCFNAENYRNNISAFLSTIGNVEKGDSSKVIADYILEKLGK